MSAWCLGVLNSHRRFFLSYTAPVVWNLSIIATLIWFGRSSNQLHWRLGRRGVRSWEARCNSFVQLPTVLKLLKRLRPVLDIVSANVREVIRNFFPVLMSRGVVQ